MPCIWKYRYMKLRTILIDDEPLALEKLRQYASRIPYLHIEGIFSSASEAGTFLFENNVDLVITDIDMPDINGIQLLRNIPNAPMAIFITAHAQYAVDSYRVGAVDYLLKPYDFEAFSEAVSRAMAASVPASPTSSNQPLFVKTDYRYVRVNPEDIIYIKGYGEYLQIFTTSAKEPILTLSSFSSIQQRLPEQFRQVHRSYIVNVCHIAQVERNRIAMSDKELIPLGDSFRADFVRYLSANAVGKKQ